MPETTTATPGPQTSTIPGPQTIGQAPAPSVGQLASSVTTNLSLLVHKEVELAKLEIGAAAKKGAVGAGGLLGGGVLLIPFGLFASVAAAEGIAEGLPRWLSYLIVALVYLLIAIIVALFGRAQIKKVQSPERTKKTVKDTIAWAKHPTTDSAAPSAAGTALSTPAATAPRPAITAATSTKE